MRTTRRSVHRQQRAEVGWHVDQLEGDEAPGHAGELRGCVDPGSAQGEEVQTCLCYPR